MEIPIKGDEPLYLLAVIRIGPLRGSGQLRAVLKQGIGKTGRLYRAGKFAGEPLEKGPDRVALVELLAVKAFDHGAAPRQNAKNAIRLERLQRFADRRAADAEITGDPLDREFFLRLDTAFEDGVANLVAGLIGKRRTLDSREP